jgi:hypothetical protein
LKSIAARIIAGLALVPKRAASDKDLAIRQQYEALRVSNPIRGNPFSKVYHRHGCEYGDKMSHTHVFASSVEAHSHGYRACSVCRPDHDGEVNW